MDYKFYIGLVEENEDGSIKSVTNITDLEKKFSGLRYKSLTGANALGAPRVYTENFVEDNKALVVTSDVLQQTDLALTLYFFDGEFGGVYYDASTIFYAFYKMIRGRKLVWYDTFRKRKILMYLNSGVSPKTDKVIGTPYIEAEFKFKNVYGESFGLSDDIFPPTTLSTT